MLSVALFCRCNQPLRLTTNKLLINGTQTRIAREFITSAKCSRNSFGLSSRSLKIRELVKSSGILARFCANTPKPKPSKAVGYWLLGCSGMVFTAVVLGMVGGYLILLYSIYYVVNLVLNSTNGSK